MTTEMTKIKEQIDALKPQYAADYRWGIRFDEQVLPVGHIFEPSRVWVDGVETSEYLGGTSAIEDDMLHVITASSFYVGTPYIVCGEMAGYGEDDGEIILRECEIMAIPEA